MSTPTPPAPPPARDSLATLETRLLAERRDETARSPTGRGFTLLSAPGTALPPEGLRFGRFRLLKELGRGRTVAIKILQPAEGARGTDADRILREGRILARLVHPHIVAVHGLGCREDAPYLVME